EDAAEPADLAHQRRVGDDGVEVEEALGHLVDQLVTAHVVGAGGTGRLRALTGGEDQDPGGLTGAVRQDDGRADHLVRLAGVDPEAEGDLDGRVELGRGGVLGQLDRFERRVEGVAVDLGRVRQVTLAALHEVNSSVDSWSSWSSGPAQALPPLLGAGSGRIPADYSEIVTPIDRAVPAMIFSASAMSLALRSSIFSWAISRTWAWVSEPTLVLCGTPLPLSRPAALRISRAAGGVLVTKVKERSSYTEISTG